MFIGKMYLCFFLNCCNRKCLMIVRPNRNTLCDNVLMTNEIHNSYNQFYSTVFCLLYMFRTNLVVHEEHGIIYCITQFWYNQYNRAVSTA